jgi:hypothetical protein
MRPISPTAVTATRFVAKSWIAVLGNRKIRNFLLTDGYGKANTASSTV